MKESVIEKYLHDQVKAQGGNTYKLAPLVAGTPDRLVMLPPGTLYLVETKAPGGKLRPVQVIWHRRAARIGVHVWVLTTKQEVDQWLTSMQST